MPILGFVQLSSSPEIHHSRSVNKWKELVNDLYFTCTPLATDIVCASVEYTTIVMCEQFETALCIQASMRAAIIAMFASTKDQILSPFWCDKTICLAK